MKKIMSIVLIFGVIFTFVSTAEAYYENNFVMGWSFQIFNNPNARQVAINTAEKQDGLIEVDDPIQDFADGLERRLYSSAQRDIVNKIMDEDEVPYGEYEAGNLNISVAEDPQTGEVLVEITDKISGESTIITYSGDNFGSGFNW